MKLSPTQLRVLRYASEGRLRQKADGRYVIEGVGPLVFDYLAASLSLERDGWIVWRWLGRSRRRRRSNLASLAEVTPKGAALLNSQVAVTDEQSDSSGAALLEEQA